MSILNEKILLSQSERNFVEESIKSGTISGREGAYLLLSKRLSSKSKYIIDFKIRNQFKEKFADFNYKEERYFDYVFHLINDSLIALEKGILTKNILDIESFYFRVLNNKINDFMNKNFKLLDEVKNTGFPEIIFEDAIDESQIDTCFDEAMEALDDRSRNLLTLFYFNDLNQKEIADILALNYGSIRNLLSVCKKKFKIFYEKCIKNG